MINYNIKLAFRNLLKNKVYSSLIIGGFSIGFAACILIGIFYFTEKNVNAGFANHSQIFRLYDIKMNACNINYDLNQALASDFTEITNTCPMEYYSGAIDFNVKDEHTNASVILNNIISTNNNFFRIFSVNVLASMTDLPFNGKESIVITESVAKRLYKNGNAVGQILNIGNSFLSYNGKITAVIKDLPENSSFKAEIILNSENENFRLSKTCDKGKCIFITNQYIQLNKGVNVENFTSLLNSRINHDQFQVNQLGLQRLDDFYLSSLPIKDMHFKGNARLLKLFVAIAALILLLSSINYLNYTISMQYAKLKTIGISKTNGAGWKQLVSYSVIEVSLGVIISVAVSIIIIFILLPYSASLFGKGLHLNKLLLSQLAPVFGVTLIAVILLNSFAPVYLLSRFMITDFLSGTRRRKGKQVGKQILLTFQMATSIALVAVVVGVFKQIHFVKNADLGFDKELLVRIDMPLNSGKPDVVKQEINKLPFVIKSTFSEGCPGRISLRMGSNTGNSTFIVNCIVVGDEYLETMGIKLLEGREFYSGDADKVCLVNEAAVKRFEFNSIEGKKFMNGREGGYEIIGITNDFHISSLYNAIDPVALIYNPEAATSMISIKLMPGNIGQYMDQIKNVWHKLFPFEIMNFTFYDEQFQSMYSKEDKMVKSITFFSFIAIILTCMGILCQIFIISIYRTKEIGIRKVNGAKVIEILAMLNKDFIRCVVIGFVIATPMAYYSMNKWLQTFAYKTKLDWWIFAFAGILALIIALITVSWQSWKAATKNPVEALRYE